MPLLSTWGRGPGNNFAMLVNPIALRPGTKGDRNGFVNLTSSPAIVGVDKTLVLTVWWPSP